MSKDIDGNLRIIDEAFLDHPDRTTNETWTLPRFGNKPMTNEFLQEGIIKILKQAGRTLTEEQIVDGFLRMKNEMMIKRQPTQ